MKRILTKSIFAVFMGVASHAAAQESCETVLSQNFYFNDDALQSFISLERECDYSSMQDSDGLPLSHVVAMSALDVKIGYYFFPRATSLETISPSGDSILHLAARNSSLGTILQLVWLGVDAQLLNEDGQSALDLLQNNSAFMREISSGGQTIRIPQNDAVAYLLDSNPEEFTTLATASRDGSCTVLCEAASSYGGERDVWVALLQGASVDTFGERGFAALHYAAAFGNTGVIGALAGAGFDIDIVDQTDGQTPLHAAAIEGKPGSIALLLDFGANATLEDSSGATAYQYALAHPSLQDHPVLERLRAATGASGEVEAVVVEASQEQRLVAAHLSVLGDFASTGRGQMHLVLNNSQNGYSPPLRPVVYYSGDDCRVAISVAPPENTHAESISFDYSDIATVFGQQIDDSSEVVVLVGLGEGAFQHQRFPTPTYDTSSDDYLSNQGNTVGDYEQLLILVPVGRAADIAGDFQSVLDLCRR